jgi:hypothetical protein
MTAARPIDENKAFRVDITNFLHGSWPGQASKS